MNKYTKVDCSFEEAGQIKASNRQAKIEHLASLAALPESEQADLQQRHMADFEKLAASFKGYSNGR